MPQKDVQRFRGNAPKRHHFVPQMILKEFLNPQGNLFFFDKRAPDDGVGEASPQNLFVQKHLYSEINSDGSRDARLESDLSELETQANAVIRKIVDCARKRERPHLIPAEKALWDYFLTLQWKRVPQTFETHMTPEAFDKSLEKNLSEFEKRHRPLTNRERQDMASLETRARLMQNVKVSTVRRPMELALDALRSRGLGIALVADARKSFVIGSNPIVKLNLPGRAHISEPTTEVWFPIASDVAVTPALGAGSETIVEVDGAVVRYINTAIHKQSKLIAGRSRELIYSLTRQR